MPSLTSKTTLKVTMINGAGFKLLPIEGITLKNSIEEVRVKQYDKVKINNNKI